MSFMSPLCAEIIFPVFQRHSVKRFQVRMSAGPQPHRHSLPTGPKRVIDCRSSLNSQSKSNCFGCEQKVYTYIRAILSITAAKFQKAKKKDIKFNESCEHFYANYSIKKFSGIQKRGGSRG